MERSLKKKREQDATYVLPEILQQANRGAFDTGLVPLSELVVESESVAEPVAWTEIPLDAEREESKNGMMTGDGAEQDQTEERFQEASLPRSSGNLVEVRHLCKGYVKAKKMIPVLQGVSLDVGPSEFLAIVGQSGSGKSTLLHLMGTLDTPDSGEIFFDGQRTDRLPAAKRDQLRNRSIGMIFQFYHLIPEMTTLENVMAPLMIRDGLIGYFRNRKNYRQRAVEMLDLVGLSHRLKHRPSELSGGEMQRASIARALITNPRILLADEPTGNLDSKTSRGIVKLLRILNHEQKLTVVMVTHDMSQAEDADRILRLVDGQVVAEFRQNHDSAPQ